MPVSRDTSPSSAEPTLTVTPPGATPDARLVDPNAPTVSPAVGPADLTRPAARPQAEDAPAPAKIGRFTVLRELGRGGTGVVYAAYDEQLDRKVAVKLLHSETREEIARARLLREAQAMARLSHPNIVGVHEVGTEGRQVYVAMEFVHGMTLHAWLKRQRRSAAEIVAMFYQAGEGLAAAHEAGLVHRDFKPANVMVGDDGRARVLDFGLARAEVEAGAAPGLDRMQPAREHTSAVANLRSLDASITVTGVMLGTPAYMAPEQFLGTRVDARSDQFGFCVALFEALYRERPYAGDTLAELMTNVLAGSVRDVPHPTAVARALRSILLRGLRRAPDERWSDMRALLTALSPHARGSSRRPWAPVLGLSAALAGAAAGVAYQTALVDQACSGGAERAAAAWDAADRAQIDAAAEALGPAAGAAATRALAVFDLYSQAWVDAFTGACSDGGELLDLRMTCLDERRRALATAVDMFARIDSDIVAHAEEILSTLPRIEACADETYLRAAVRPPDDPAVAAQVRELRGELQKASTLETGGKFEAALAALDQALAAAPRYAPLLAELNFRRGSVLENDGRYEDARKAFEAAFLAAVESDHREVIPDAATRLAYINGRRLDLPDAAEDWLRHAETYAKRQGETRQHARALIIRGALRNHNRMRITDPTSDVETGAVFEEARRLLEEAGAEDSIDYARYLRFYGDFLTFARQEHAASIAAEEQALAIMQRHLGRGHPDVAMVHNSLGIALMHAGRNEESARTLRAALDADTDPAHQRNHVYMTLWSNLGEAYSYLGRVEEELAARKEAFEVLERSSERLLPETFALRSAYAHRLAERGRLDRSLAEFDALYARGEATWGPRSLRLVGLFVRRGAVFLAVPDLAKARADLDRALALCSGTDDNFAEDARWLEARVLAAEGRTAEAHEKARALRPRLVARGASGLEPLKELDALLAGTDSKKGGDK